MPLAGIMQVLKEQGKHLDYAPIHANLIPSQAELAKYGVFQEVKFVGYPIGIWDEKNNLPIMRRGMTATDPAIDYNGRGEFLVNAAVYPGSSGSPVYIANETSWFGCRSPVPVFVGEIHGNTVGGLPVIRLRDT